MNTKIKTMLAAVPLVLGSQMANSAVGDINLYDYAFNIDGTVATSLPGLNLGGFDTNTGLGSISFSINSAGSHSFGAFFDHEIDEAVNTYFNEVGSTIGSAAAGQSWEIDEPGWFDGDIYENFQNSALDNGIGTSVYGNTVFPDDVSMAMGWDFSLGVDETALISLVLSTVDPGDSFFRLVHTDPDSDVSIYLRGSLDIRSGGPGPGPSVPEPSILWLFGAGLIGFTAQYRSRKKIG